MYIIPHTWPVNRLNNSTDGIGVLVALVTLGATAMPVPMAVPAVPPPPTLIPPPIAPPALPPPVEPLAIEMVDDDDNEDDDDDNDDDDDGITLMLDVNDGQLIGCGLPGDETPYCVDTIADVCKNTG